MDEKLEYQRQAIREANEADGVEDFIIDAIDQLLVAGLIEARRGESGEWYFTNTEAGNKAAEYYQEVHGNPFEDEEN